MNNIDARKKFLQQLLAFDRQLADAGVPKLSRFWRRALTSFFNSSRRRLVLRVGRRGGKSLTLCKLAVAWALFGPWSVAVGDIAIIPFVSVDRTEATARLRTIATYLDTLRFPYARRSDELELTGDRKVIFRVVTASARTAVGFTSISIFCDEVARWRDLEIGANPAREIVASLTPTMATVPLGFLVLSSSPWSTNDFHHESFSRGDDDYQLVAHAPTWIANPTITEEETHALEPQEVIWRREFLAEPSDAVSSVIGEAELSECISRGIRKRPAEEGAHYTVLCDIGLRHDRTAIVVAHREIREVGAVLYDVVVIDSLRLLKPELFGLKRVSLDDVSKAISADSREYNGATVFLDIHYSDAIVPSLKQMGIGVRELPMAPSAQGPRITTFIAHLSNRTIDLVDDEEMKKEILQAQLVHHPGGRVTLSAPARRDAHDDILDCLLLACDPSTVVRLQPIEREIVVQRGPTLWDRETMTLTTDVRYFRRRADGSLAPGEPPYGCPRFAEMAEDLKTKGQFTPSTLRWFAENPNGAPEQARPINNQRERKRYPGWLFHKG